MNRSPNAEVNGSKEQREFLVQGTASVGRSRKGELVRPGSSMKQDDAKTVVAAQVA